MFPFRTVTNPFFHQLYPARRKSVKLQQAPSLEKIIETAHSEIASQDNNVLEKCSDIADEETAAVVELKELEFVR